MAKLTLLRSSNTPHSSQSQAAPSTPRAEERDAAPEDWQIIWACLPFDECIFYINVFFIIILLKSHVLQSLKNTVYRSSVVSAVGDRWPILWSVRSQNRSICRQHGGTKSWNNKKKKINKRGKADPKQASLSSQQSSYFPIQCGPDEEVGHLFLPSVCFRWDNISRCSKHSTDIPDRRELTRHHRGTDGVRRNASPNRQDRLFNCKVNHNSAVDKGINSLKVFFPLISIKHQQTFAGENRSNGSKADNFCPTISFLCCINATRVQPLIVTDVQNENVHLIGDDESFIKLSITAPQSVVRTKTRCQANISPLIGTYLCVVWRAHTAE